MRRTCVCSFAGLQFLRCAGARSCVFAAVGFVFATNVRGGVRGRRSRRDHPVSPSRDVSPRIAETNALRRIARRSQPRLTGDIILYIYHSRGRSFRLSERISPLRNCRRLIAWRIMDGRRARELSSRST